MGGDPVSGRFTSPGETPVDPAQFAVAVSVGLAIISDEAVSGMTGGVMPPPAAVLVLDVVSAGGVRPAQILISADSLAALYGSMSGWVQGLPAAARDQFQALADESSAKWVERLAEYLGGNR